MPYLDLAAERIYYALHRNGTGRLTILLIHGAGENHLVWPAGLRHLADAAVYAIDLPGHGKSTGIGRSTIEDYADWTAAFLDAIETQQAILIGHSMGGAIAQRFGWKYPERTRGLVLIATGAKLRVAPKILELTRDDLGAAADLISDCEWGASVPEEIKRQGKRQLLANQPQVIHNDYRACDRFDMIEQLNEITAPTLIIAGTADQLTPLKYARFMAERIPNARLIAVPDAGHMVMIEAETVAACAVEEFVRDLQM